MNIDFRQTKTRIPDEHAIAGDEWRDVVLEDVASEITVGYVGPMASKYVKDGIPFLRSQNVDYLRINTRDIKYITPEFHERLRKSSLTSGDVVIVRTGKPGTCAVIPPWLPVANCSDLVIVRCGDTLDANFLAYFVNSIASHHVTAHLVGAVQQHFNVGSARKIRLKLPSVEEQKAIANFLRTLDDKIELNQQMNKMLEGIGKSIFERCFVDFEFPNEEGKPYKSSGGEMILNEVLKKEIPKEWKVSKIDEELRTVLGGTPDTSNKSYWEGGHIPWINSGSINEFPVIKPTAYITELGLSNSAAKLMPTKTVVMPFVISVGKEIKISITALETSGNQSVLGIIENDKIPSEFIYYWISYIKEDIYSWATGGAQQHINKNNVDNSPILIPENETIELFKKLMFPIFEKIIKNSHEIQTLSKIRDHLLPKLMSGKIRVPFQREIGEA